MTFTPDPLDDDLDPPRLQPVLQFEIAWTDAALHDASVEGRIVADFERSRRFTHKGAAIAWSRRQLFHGAVFGDAVEMRVVTLYEWKGERRESIDDDPIEITLPGFRRTHAQRQFHGPWKLTVEKPEKRHRECH
jgi:hypothetical protein